MTHRGHQTPHDDGPSHRCRGLLPVDESGQHRIHHVVERQSAVDVQFRCEPEFGVDHVVRGEIGHTLQGHPMQRVGGLHHGDGMRERFEVAHQRPTVRGGAKPRGQFGLVSAGQSVVADLGGDVDDRRRPQSTVEVVVQ